MRRYVGRVGFASVRGESSEGTKSLQPRQPERGPKNAQLVETFGGQLVFQQRFNLGTDMWPMIIGLQKSRACPLLQFGSLRIHLLNLIPKFVVHTCGLLLSIRPSHTIHFDDRWQAVF
jgi:hypothetical protein